MPRLSGKQLRDIKRQMQEKEQEEIEAAIAAGQEPNPKPQKKKGGFTNKQRHEIRSTMHEKKQDLNISWNFSEGDLVHYEVYDYQQSKKISKIGMIISVAQKSSKISEKIKVAKKKSLRDVTRWNDNVLVMGQEGRIWVSKINISKA